MIILYIKYIIFIVAVVANVIKKQRKDEIRTKIAMAMETGINDEFWSHFALSLRFILFSNVFDCNFIFFWNGRCVHALPAN